MAEETIQPAGVSEDDIVFACPFCGKSLAIDKRGAGLTIDCVDCHNPVQVPMVVEVAEEDPATLEDAIAQIRALRQQAANRQAQFNELNLRRASLEKWRATHLNLRDRITAEAEQMQGVIDRVSALHDRLRTEIEQMQDSVDRVTAVLQISEE
jgi:transcription elongation factor Elf1